MANGCAGQVGVTKALGAVLALAFAVAVAAQAAEPFPLDFVTGDYVLIGRQPDGGAAYAGQARIEAAGKQLKLLRRLDAAATETFVGAIESAAGGDARVVRFRGPAKGARTFTCLVASDLDNYARLTCYWTYDSGPDAKEPGLETLFATGAWPDEAAHKEFRN